MLRIYGNALNIVEVDGKVLGMKYITWCGGQVKVECI